MSWKFSKRGEIQTELLGLDKWRKGDGEVAQKKESACAKVNTLKENGLLEVY